MVLLLLCGLLATLCAVFGVYRFTSDYTCKLFGFSAWTKKWCMNVAWIPSGCIALVVLAIAVIRSMPMGMPMGMPTGYGDY